ncbi:hypothetical protein ACFX58_19430 [Sphingomonas sp. NCPPB 2930]
MNFKASNYAFALEDEAMIMTLSDDKENPVHYIILQKSIAPEKNFSDSSLDGCYFESSESESIGYDLLTSYDIKDSLLKLSSKSFEDLVVDVSLLNLSEIESLKKNLKELIGDINKRI